MALFRVRLAGLLAWLSIALIPLAQAQPPGLPGTATPQPYAQPQIRTISPAPRSSPPLLVNPHQPRSRMAVPPPQPRDQPLPQLKSGWERQTKPAAISADKP